MFTSRPTVCVSVCLPVWVCLPLWILCACNMWEHSLTVCLSDGGEFGWSFWSIYPSELELKCEHQDKHTTFLAPLASWFLDFSFLGIKCRDRHQFFSWYIRTLTFWYNPTTNFEIGIPCKLLQKCKADKRSVISSPGYPLGAFFQKKSNFFQTP